MSITVEIALYSGRPNPAFGLSVADAGELERRIARLPRAVTGATMPDGLGYRGVRIVAHHAPFSEILVANGVVAVRDRAGKTRFHADPGRSLERWLIERSVGHLSDSQRAWLREELAR